MQWSYTDPSSIPKDAVRLTIGDTDASDPILFDEEISALLLSNGQSVSAASLFAVEAIIAKLSRLCDQSVGSVSASYSQQREGYMALRGTLKLRASYGGGIPYAGGINRFDVILNERDRTQVRPMFTTRMMNTVSRNGAYRDSRGILGDGLLGDECLDGGQG